jgi:hypothetical protein
MRRERTPGKFGTPGAEFTRVGSRGVIRRSRGRPGSATVESAIYFPFIVLGIMFTIYVMIDLYSIASLQAHLHLSVRAESCRISGATDVGGIGNGTGYDRYRTAAFAKRIKTGKGRSSNTTTATGSVSAKYGAGRMAGSVKTEQGARSYAIRETDGLRSALRI